MRAANPKDPTMTREQADAIRDTTIAHERAAVNLKIARNRWRAANLQAHEAAYHEARKIEDAADLACVAAKSAPWKILPLGMAA